MKFFSLIFTLTLLFSFVFSPAVFADHEDSSDFEVHQVAQATETTEAGNTAPEKVDVNALFWPIVPGTTVADSMFWAKQLKESLLGMFTFNNVAKAEKQIEVSEKRFVEANKLFEEKDYDNAFKSLDLSSSARKQALELKRKEKEANKDVVELSKNLVASLEKQKKALTFIETQLPEEQKSKASEILKELELQISEAQ